MHLLFIDESGNPSPPGKTGPKHFVLGGVIIPEEIWPKLSFDLKRLKKAFNVKAEIKWRYFIAGNQSPQNSLLHLAAEKRDELRMQLFRAVGKYKSIKIISVIANVQKAYTDKTIKTILAFTRGPNYQFYYLLKISNQACGAGSEPLGGGGTSVSPRIFLRAIIKPSLNSTSSCFILAQSLLFK